MGFSGRKVADLRKVLLNLPPVGFAKGSLAHVCNVNLKIYYIMKMIESLENRNLLAGVSDSDKTACHVLAAGVSMGTMGVAQMASFGFVVSAFTSTVLAGAADIVCLIQSNKA